MALKDLKSDLSWYGKTPPAANNIENIDHKGFVANIMPVGTGRPDSQFIGINGIEYTSTSILGTLSVLSQPGTTTKFNNDGSSPSVMISGFDANGNILPARSKVAADSFQIDDITFSDRGLASRKAQLGDGTKFPIGPEGQLHQFDKARIGFSNESKYGDSYGVKFKNAGLADTYTANSPIDDMYNKFNLRDDATPNSYIKHPLILRGIQRRDNSDPQRWGINVGPGLSGAFDIPRGGIITAANRTLIDAVRHAKFLASPKGIGFLAKQVGYQLMNPKPETRIYNPLSLGSIAPIVHINRHVGGGFLEKAGDLISSITGGDKPDLHEKLREDLFSGFDKDNSSKIPSGGEISELSSKIGGPGSLLGIGGTSITRYGDTSLKTQKSEIGGLKLDNNKDKYHLFSYGEPYLKKRDANESGKTSGAQSESDADRFDTSLAKTYTNWPTVAPDRGGRGTSLEGGGIPELKEKNIVDDYTRMAYGAIPTRTAKKGNKDSRITNHNDFRDSGQSQELKIGWENDKQIDEIDGEVDGSLIKFSIGGIKFKAYLGSLNDAFAPSWNGQQDQGRADSRYLYESFERTISTDFIVPIYSADDRSTIWGKLQNLARITYPVYKSEGFYGQATKLTIGDMYKNKDVIITDLSYDWDAETPWEITEGQQAPFYTNVSITFIMLDSKPQSSTKIYGNI